MLPLIHSHQATTPPTLQVTSIPSLPVSLPAMDQYTVAAAVNGATLLIMLMVLLFASAPKHPSGYARVSTADSDASLEHDDDDGDKHEVDDYAYLFSKAVGTPIDHPEYEASKLFVHITLAVLSVIGLALDATAVVQTLISSQERVPTTILFLFTSVALRTLDVVLAMLPLNITESRRLTMISYLTFTWLLAELLIVLVDFRLHLPGLGGEANVVLHTVNLVSGAVAFGLAFLSPTGPRMEVETSAALPAKQVVRNEQGGGSVLQTGWGFSALPVVAQAYKKNRIDEEDIPALDYTYRSAVVADEMIREYRRALADSLARHPVDKGRTLAHKGRALFRALVKCNARNLTVQGWVLLVTTFSFYLPKLGLSLLLSGIEQYERSLRDDKEAKDSVESRARATLIYSAVFYITLMWESWIVYYYFRPLSVYMKSHVQTQLTTLLAWKRLQQKEASSPNTDDSHTEEKHRDAELEGGPATSSSQVINLVTTDVQRIFGRIDMYGFGIMGPLEVLVGGYSAYWLMGKGAIIGLLVAALLQPVAIFLGRVTERIDERLQKARDKRVALLSEAIRAIRMIKYEAWEDAIGRRIMGYRKKELKAQTQSWIVFTFFGGFFALVPMLTIVVAFGWYVLVEGNTLTASVAFPAVATLVELRFAVSFLPEVFLNMIQGWVSMKRIAAYLETDEVESFQGTYKPETMAGAKDVVGIKAGVGRISLRAAEITWPSTVDPVSPSSATPQAASSTTTAGESALFSLSVPEATFEVGQTNLVCGKIGSGKTLLLLSLLGEAELTAGSVECPRSHPAASVFAARSANASTSRRWWIDLSLSSYAPQRPFLFNATVRDNILFGLEYNASRYRDVIFACGLKPDLKIFKDGDRTEIGEGGTNLSGGQKARISLARAIYSHAGTVLIDDCLSALDSHTTKHICEKLFDDGKDKGGLLEGRTVVLVTHHVRLMAPRCSKVLVLQEGRQAFFGSSEQFTNSIFYQGLENEVEEEQRKAAREETPNFGSNSSTANNSDEDEVDEDTEREANGLLDLASADKNASAFSTNTVVRRRASVSAFSHISGLGEGEEEVHKQISDEKRAQGRVSFAVYSGYIMASGGVILWIFLIASFCGNAGADLCANYWLRLWTQASSDPMEEHSTEWWFYRWVIIQSLQVIAITLGHALVCTASLLAGSRLFAQLLRTVLRAPLGFHDSTPSGRLLNRFGKDMQAIDTEIGDELVNAAKSLLMAAASLVATYLGGGPLILVVLFFISPAFYILVTTFTVAARDLKRLDSNAASKRITCFTDLITGVVTIRAFGQNAAYFGTLMERLDENIMYYYWQTTVRQWQSLLLSMASSVFVIFTVLIVTMMPGTSAAKAGFTLTFVQSLTSMLQFGLRSMSNVEQVLVAVERVMEYFDVKSEPLDAPPASTGEEIKVSPQWPAQGRIEIRDLHLAYAENLPDVLDGIDLSIKPGERVGIVGATGSGKSTLVSALFRFFEYRSGQIEIDGVDIARVGLKTLRSRMKIVPQDPLILSGTLRSAVDPLEQYSDEAITRVLVRVGLLKDRPSSPTTGYGTFEITPLASNMSRDAGSTSSSTLLSRSSPATTAGDDNSGTLSSLEARIEESGSNLSSGQKQLLSLSRILLSSSSPETANSIVVLDESTSSIDYATDAKVQTLLDSHFAAHNTTVLAIAHRLRSIIGFDTVVVLNRGKVVEKGNPVELLKMEDGWFNKLVKSTGEEEYVSLRKMIGM